MAPMTTRWSTLTLRIASTAAAASRHARWELSLPRVRCRKSGNTLLGLTPTTSTAKDDGALNERMKTHRNKNNWLDSTQACQEFPFSRRTFFKLIRDEAEGPATVFLARADEGVGAVGVAPD